jgi:hypothetical protein
MQVSEQTVLQLPLSLLYELEPPELIDGKIYIKFPFYIFFDKINVAGLYHSTVTFSIIDCYEINNYANSFSLITKVYMHDTDERNRLISIHSHEFIQQIGTLYVSSRAPHDGRSYQIQTNILNGPTKGFLIQCRIQDLTSIKFYINDLLRVDYNRFLILNACVKISDNLIYMPFNDFPDFKDRGTNTFSGSINLSRLQNSTLCLQFSANQRKVVIHNVYFNHFRQSNGLGGLYIDYRPAFIENTTTDHPIQHIIGTPPNTSLLDMSGNFIQTGPNIYNTPIFDMSYNYSFTPMVGTYTAASTGPVSNYHIPNGSVHYRILNSDRITCNITHEDIADGQRYMTCSNCENIYAEDVIKQWLRQRTGNLRTCPTCREVWTNFDVYINSSNEVN